MAYEDEMQEDPTQLSGIPEPGSPLMRAWEQTPGAMQIMGANAYRGQNTILGGPSNGIRGRLGIGSGKGPGAVRSLGPTHWGSLGSYDAVGGWDVRDAGDKKYTPFAQLGKAANWTGNKALRHAHKSHVALGEKLAGAAGSADELAKTPWARMKSAGMVTDDMVQGNNKANLMNGGWYSRVSAAQKLGRGGNVASGRKGKSVGRMLQKTDKALFDNIGMAAKDYKGMSRTSASHLIGGSQEGFLSRRAAGYMAGLRGGGMEGSVHSALTLAGRGSYIGGFEAAGSALAAGEGGGLLGGGIAKAAEKGMASKFIAASTLKTVGKAIPYVNVAMWAWTAYDFIKAGAAALKEVPGFIGDAATSFKGDMGRPMFGSGFKDNSVAATSRQRGVAAIQNSRLNARSVLGSEAAPLAAHFG